MSDHISRYVVSKIHSDLQKIVPYTGIILDCSYQLNSEEYGHDLNNPACSCTAVDVRYDCLIELQCVISTTIQI